MGYYFELFLVVATLLTGLYSLIDILWLAPKRKLAHVVKMPMLSENARSFFPILLLVLIIRSFIVEPFRIPTSSLQPSLLIGDFIFVNKFAYGLRWPLFGSAFVKVKEPKQGDITVFRYPPDPKIAYIKRVIGVPGDHIQYIDKILYINGKKIPQKWLMNTIERDNGGALISVKEYMEELPGQKHLIYKDPNKANYDFKDIVVPKGYYFMMGDNRDNSADSRFWGFVPEKNLIGKAFLVWFSWDSFAEQWKDKFRWSQMGWVNK